jgi:hypothetical protein
MQFGHTPLRRGMQLGIFFFFLYAKIFINVFIPLSLVIQ